LYLLWAARRLVAVLFAYAEVCSFAGCCFCLSFYSPLLLVLGFFYFFFWGGDV